MTVTSNIHYNLTAWTVGAVSLGARRSNGSPLKAYEAQNAGTSAAAGPTHASGTVADGGGVNWKFLSLVDYTSLSAWAAGIPATLVDAVVGLLWNNGEIVSASQFLNLSGHATTAGFTITVRAATGESFADHPNKATNALAYAPANGVALSFTGGYVGAIGVVDSNTFLNGLQIKVSAGNATPLQPNGSVGSNLSVSQCIFDGANTALSAGGGQVVLTMNHCLLIARGAGNVMFVFHSANLNNCTLIGTTYSATRVAVQGNYGNSVVKNCISFGSGKLLSGSGGATWNNGVTDGDNTGGVGTVTSNLSGKTDANQFVSATTDFRLKTGSDALDIAPVISGLTAIDIVGTVRPQGSGWDVGAWELASAGAPAIIRQQLFVVS